MLAGNRNLRWLALSLAIIALDQWSKALVLVRLALGERVTVFDGWWDFTLAYNEGVAFSMMGEGSTLQRYGLTLLAVGVAGGLVAWLRKLPIEDRLSPLCFALVIGGALGNAIDRVRLGHVVDFVLWYWRDHYWPAFNVADSAICVGAVLLLVAGLFHPKAHGETA